MEIDLESSIQRIEKDLKAKEKAEEVTLTIEDLRELEKYLISNCGMDTLDIVELLVKIEEMKNITLDV